MLVGSEGFVEIGDLEYLVPLVTQLCFSLAVSMEEKKR